MSTFRNPVGPQPAKVYWRRRLVVGLGLLAVIVIIILIVARPGSGTPTSSPSTTPSSTSTSTSTSAATSAPGAPCDPAKVTVEATTDSNNYAAGVNPLLSFSLKSLMTEPCTFSAGSDVQEFRITSGDELIWSSKDCQTAEEPATTVLTPGVPKGGPLLPWDRTRSDTCEGERTQVTAGGASYHLEVIVDGIESANDTQFLLN